MNAMRAKAKGAVAPFVALCLAAGLSLAAATARGDAPAPVVENLPAPGSYVLNRIQRTPDALLLDESGRPARLSALTRGAVTALGFFYGHCVDPSGCPVAWSVFEAARHEAASDPLLKTKLRLVFVSLDPERDSPAAMRLLRDAEDRGGATVPWAFLTGASDRELSPLLAAMGQDVSAATDAAGQSSGVINHMLKVFLIDPDGWVREIYTTAFLTPDNLLNDARTLAMAHAGASNKREAP